MANTYDLSFLGLPDAAQLSFLAKYASSLDSGQKFNQKNITYSFYTSALRPASYDTSVVPSGQFVDFQPFNLAEQTAVKALVSFLSHVIDLSFTEVAAGSGLVRFEHHNMNVGGYAGYPGGAFTTVFVNNTYAAPSDPYFIEVLWHEFGHALGLTHPTDNSALLAGGGHSGSGPQLPVSLDSTVLSIMSYDQMRPFNASYSALDIAQLLNFYGPSKLTDGINYVFTKTVGSSYQSYVGTSYNINLPEGNVFWVCGTRGNDTVDVSACKQSTTQGVAVDANIGTVDWTSDSSFRIADYATQTFVNTAGTPANLYFYPVDNINSFPVEKLILTDTTDTISVGTTFKEIDSGAGTDLFTGFAGGVTLDGGSGTDRLTLTGKSSDYVLSRSGSATLVTEKSSQSVMTLISFEALKFSDTSLVVNASGNFVFAPLPTDDSFTVNEETLLTGNVLTNDLVAGFTLTARLFTGASHGVLSFQSNGDFTYAPYRDYVGTDSFSYFLQGTGASSDPFGKVNLGIAPVNDAPQGVPDKVLTVAGKAVSGNILINDRDADEDTLTASLVSDVSNGSLKLQTNGNFTYTPKAGFTGTDSFVYKAADAVLSSSNTTVSITVQVPENEAVTRFQKPDGVYFYTASAAEAQVVRTQYKDWADQGTVFFADDAVIPGATTVYRFASLTTTGYFYTASATERDAVIATYGPLYRYEGPIFSIPSSSDSSPVYRFADTRSVGVYLFTQSTAERDAAKGLAYMRNEGVAFDAPQSASSFLPQAISGSVLRVNETRDSIFNSRSTQTVFKVGPDDGSFHYRGNLPELPNNDRDDSVVMTASRSGKFIFSLGDHSANLDLFVTKNTDATHVQVLQGWNFPVNDESEYSMNLEAGDYQIQIVKHAGTAESGYDLFIGWM